MRYRRYCSCSHKIKLASSIANILFIAIERLSPIKSTEMMSRKRHATISGDMLTLVSIFALTFGEAFRQSSRSLSELSSSKYAILTDKHGSSAKRVLPLNYCSFSGVSLNANLNPNSGGFYFEHVVSILNSTAYEISENFYADSECQVFVTTYEISKYIFPNQYVDIELSNSFSLPEMPGHFEEFFKDVDCNEINGFMFWPVASSVLDSTTCMKANPILWPPDEQGVAGGVGYLSAKYSYGSYDFSLPECTDSGIFH